MPKLLILAWAVAFFGGYVAFYLKRPKDFGLATGWNWVSVFIGWQVVAACVAIVAAAASRSVERGRALRWLGMPPLAATVLLVLAIVGGVFFANMQRPSPDPEPPRAVTAPAVDLAQKPDQ